MIEVTKGVDKMLKISIVVPVYNMGSSLEKCIESLLKQTYSNIEVIIVNDGSSDNTYDICQTYKSNSKIRDFHTENHGAGVARNYGIEKSTGDFVYFMDADDVLDSKAISKVVNTITKTNSDLVVFGYQKSDSKNKLISIKEFKDEIFSAQYIREHYDLFFDVNFNRGIQGPPWNKIFNLSIIKKYNIQFPALKRHQDEVFISRYINHSKVVSFMRGNLYTHFINDANLRFKKFPVTYIEIVKELYNQRMDTVFNWNKGNKRLEALIYIEYIYNSIKAYDMIFTPKANMNRKEKMIWLRKEIETVPIKKDILSHYGFKKNIKILQIIIFLKFINRKKIISIYYMIKFRVYLETNFGWLLNFMKKQLFNKLRQN